MIRLQPGCALWTAERQSLVCHTLVWSIKTFVEEIIEQEGFEVTVLLKRGSNVAQKDALRKV